MQYTEFEQLFLQSCQNNGVTPPTSKQIELFYQFTDHLLTVNQITNLTAIREIPDVIAKHYVDSLLASPYIPKNARVLDIGCGPGFPSIPLAITRPDLNITALDSTQKKINFVNDAKEKLSLQNLTAISNRAEDHDFMKKIGSFDVVVSRAVARLNILCELALPYVQVDGFLLAMKAAKADEELASAQKAIKILGGSDATICKATLTPPQSEAEERALIIIQKSAPTPAIYPRPFATIKKKEL